MPDEHVQWERVSSQPAAKGDFQPRQTTADLRRASLKENPHRYEAEYDRLLLRWSIGILLLLTMIILLVWQIWFA